jgi:hypothetical protein
VSERASERELHHCLHLPSPLCADAVVLDLVCVHNRSYRCRRDSFTRLDYSRIYETMQRPAFVFDGRNILDHSMLREIGFEVIGIGKPTPSEPELTPSAAEAAAVAENAARARVQAGAAPPSDSALVSPMAQQSTNRGSCSSAPH